MSNRGLRETLEAEGGEVAAAIAPDNGAEPTGGKPAGARIDGASEHGLAVELIREGYLLHYGGSGRLLKPDDADLALLAGDRMYALGLARLAELGDLQAVARLAEVIARSAQGHVTGDPALAEAAWDSLRGS
jgi:hypothetical protein